MKNNNVILLLGSNINPEKHINRALDLLARQTHLVARSRIWETAAVGSSGPNFLNVAVNISTELNISEIKAEVITPVENRLGRVRTDDKFAPRTMDIDIIVFNDRILDANLWEKAFIALPVSELSPNLIHPHNKKTLSEIAAQLKNSAYAELFK